jgi:hypothetical protein
VSLAPARRLARAASRTDAYCSTGSASITSAGVDSLPACQVAAAEGCPRRVSNRCARRHRRQQWQAPRAVINMINMENVIKYTWKIEGVGVA